jgi:hypothetical protein
MRIFSKKLMIPITCMFTLIAVLSPFNLHTFVEFATNHPIGEYWAIEDDSHHHSPDDHDHATGHRHTSDPESSDPEHEYSQNLYHSRSSLIYSQDFSFAHILSASFKLFSADLEVRAFVPPIKIDTGPPNTVLLLSLRRLHPETAPPPLV